MWGLSFFTLRSELKLSPKTTAQRTDRHNRERERPCFIVSMVLSSLAIPFYCDLPTGVVFVCRIIIAVFPRF